MEDFLIGMAVNVVLTTIAMCIKNPTKAKKLKSALLKVRDQINMLYPGE